MFYTSTQLIKMTNNTLSVAFCFVILFFCFSLKKKKITSLSWSRFFCPPQRQALCHYRIKRNLHVIEERFRKRILKEDRKLYSIKHLYMYTICHVYVLWQPYVLINLQKVSTYNVIMPVLRGLLSGLSLTYGDWNKSWSITHSEIQNRNRHHN